MNGQGNTPENILEQLNQSSVLHLAEAIALAQQRSGDLRLMPQEKILEAVQKRILDTYYTFDVDLAIARTAPGLETNIAGFGLHVIAETNDDATANISVRFNRPDASPVTMELLDFIKTPFRKFYITNTAQAGKKFTMVVVRERDLFELLRAPSLSLEILNQLKGSSTGTFNQTTMGAAAALLVASNTNRKSVFVNNDPTSTGDLCLGFDNTVATNKCYIRMTAGQSWSADDYLGDVYGIRSAATTIANYNEVA